MDNRIENLSLKDLVELHDRIARRIWELEKGKLSEKLGEFQDRKSTRLNSSHT